MTQNVDFILRVRPDPASRTQLSAWENSLLSSIRRIEQARLTHGRMTLHSLHQLQMRYQSQLMASMSSSNQRALAAQRAQMASHLAQQMRMWMRHAAQVRAAMQAATAGLGGGPPNNRGGGGGGGGGRGGNRAIQNPMQVGAGLLASGLGGVSGLAGFAAVSRGALPAFAAYAGARFATRSVGAFADIESQQIQLRVLTGSQEAADDLLKKLRGVQQMFGMSMQSLADVSKVMIAFGVDTEDTADKLGRFSAITGGNTDAMYRLGRAYGQVRGLGKLMAEETNQLIDAGFSPLISVANMTGETVAQVRKRMADGGVSFDEFRESVERATNSGGKFAGMMEAMANSTTAKIGRMTSEWQRFQQELGKSLAGDDKKLIENALTGAPSAISRASFIVNPTYENFESVYMQRGRELANQGLKLGSRENSQVGQAARKLGFKVAGEQYGVVDNDGILRTDLNEEDKRALKTYETQQRLDKLSKETAATKAKSEKASKEFAEKEVSLVKQMSSERARELGVAFKVNELRIKGAEKELKLRKEMLEEAKKTTKEARDSLLSAQEKFGGLSSEEQRQAISTLLVARTRGVAGLSLEQIGQIRSIGTKEADNVAGAALRHRAGAAFGEESLGLGGVQGRREAIQTEISQKSKRLDDITDGRLLGRRSGQFQRERFRLQNEIENLRSQDSNLELSERSISQQVGQRRSIRGSVFAGERRELMEAQRNQANVQASVNQTIQFVARFDNTAQQIANQVMELSNQAMQNQLSDVMKLLKPIRKDIEAFKMRRAGNTG